MTLTIHTEAHPGARGLTLRVHRFVANGAPATGSTVLLLHGFLDAGKSWDLVAGPLARAGHEVLAPDLRGFGECDRVGVGGYYHFPDYVADVDALVRSLAPSRLILAGHSMGGTIACLYAGSRPERVARLALLEGLGPPSMPTEMSLFRMRTWLDDLAAERAPKPLASVDDALRRLQQNHPHVALDVLCSRVPHLTVRRADGTLAWAFDPLHRTTSPTPFQLPHFACFLREIRCPVLVFGGGENGYQPMDLEERLAALPSPASRVELPNAGHMMHWTEPEAVAAALLELAAR